MKISWTPNAIRQLDHVHAYYADVDRRLAARVFRTVRQSVRHLAQFPAAGRPGAIPGTREVVVRDLPFVVVYRRGRDGVEIIRVLHTAADWQTGLQ